MGEAVVRSGFLTVREVGLILGIDPPEVRTLIKEGRLAAIQVGPKNPRFRPNGGWSYRIPRLALDQFVERELTGPVTPPAPAEGYSPTRIDSPVAAVA